VDGLDPTIRDDPRVTRYWADFCEQVRLPDTTPFQAWYFGDSADLAHELVELVLNGPKRGTASLGWTADLLPHTMPIVGGYSVITEFDGTPRGVLRTTSLERCRFGDVDAAFAWDEGEGDRSLADWRAGHLRFFSRECVTLGRTMSDDAAVVLERFELVYPFERALDPVDCGPRIVPGYVPGALAQCAALQIAYYTRKHGFSHAFEVERLRDLAGFIEDYDGSRDGLWLLVDEGRVLGSIAIDAREAEPQLRWFFVEGALRGRGWGRRLMASAIAHCRARHPRIALQTFDALVEARALYDAFGFRQVGSDRVYDGYRSSIVEQNLEWIR
jgi:uncharacterized protein YhfF/GNAT superfamily N-acetyltransferase